MQEVWKDVPGYGGLYQVSNIGGVKHMPRKLRFVSKRGTVAWRTTTERECAWNVTRTGYAIVHLTVDGARRTPTVHELVMAAFVGPRPEGMQVNHINGVKQDNRVGNLEYVTCRENHLHAVRTGLNKQAMRVAAVLRGEVVAQYASLAEAARAVGGSIAYAARNGVQSRGFHWVIL